MKNQVIKMKNNNCEYKLIDFIRIPFSISPGIIIIILLFDKIIYALIPSLQVLAIANFIDVSIELFNGQATKSQIILPTIFIMLLISYKYLIKLINLAHEKLRLKTMEKFRLFIIEKRSKLEYRHVENNETWELIKRVGNDPTERLLAGFNNITKIGELLIYIGSILLVLVTQIWWIALVIFILSIPLFGVAIKSGKTNYKASKEANKHSRRAEYIHSLLIGRQNIEERALFGYSDKLSKQYKKKYLTAYNINFATQLRNYIKMRGSNIITSLISVIIVGTLILPIKTGEITTGMFIGLASAIFKLVPMLSWNLLIVTSELSNSLEYISDLNAFSKLSETSNANDLPVECGITEPKYIEFRNVSFAYPGMDKLVLNNLNLKLYSRKHYAFVGANGAGKSTIIKLLTGLYDNYSGDILIEEKNLRDYSHKELKALFSVVYQDFAKYKITLEDSIGIGDINSVSADSINDVINVLGLNDLIHKLPKGIKTPLGKIKEKGVDISGGQWQKIAIARLLVSGSPIHILDEPTASLDPVSESELYELINKISKNKSTIFITHRLGAARIADEIIVIADGHVAEQGEHKELINKGGIYAKMFESQRWWYN